MATCSPARSLACVLASTRADRAQPALPITYLLLALRGGENPQSNDRVRVRSSSSVMGRRPGGTEGGTERGREGERPTTLGVTNNK